MELLKERILKDGIVIMPDILRVDSFLNHQIDCTLYRQIAKEFKERFKDVKINKILTIEASGIGIALATAFEFDDVPVVFAKKGTAKTTSTHLYTSKVPHFLIYSFDFLYALLFILFTFYFYIYFILLFNKNFSLIRHLLFFI